jgi:hypothetical protein
MKIGYQLKQVRERLAKGLVDKGILRTEKRNFLLFDMATHPVADGGAKDEIKRRVRAVLTNRTVVLPPSPFPPDGMEFRYLRTIAMLCAAYAANVLENALVTLDHEARERAFAQVDELLAEYSQWPFGRRTGGAGAVGANLDQVIRDEVNGAKDKELQLEVRCVTHCVAKVVLTVSCRLSRPASAYSPGLTPSSRFTSSFNSAQISKNCFTLHSNAIRRILGRGVNEHAPGHLMKRLSMKRNGCGGRKQAL